MSERTSCNPLLGAGSKSTRSCCAEVQALPSPSPHSSLSPRSTAATAQWAPNPLGDTGPPWCHTLPGHLQERHLLHLPQGCPGNLWLMLRPPPSSSQHQTSDLQPFVTGFLSQTKDARAAHRLPCHPGTGWVLGRLAAWKVAAAGLLCCCHLPRRASKSPEKQLLKMSLALFL